MHKLLEYVCNELMELEEKVERDGQLTMQEIQLVDTLAHTKKNLLKAQEMEQGSYSMRGSYAGGGGSYGRGSYDGSYRGSYDSSYARRGGRRDSMGRYSGESGYSREEAYEAEHKRMLERLKQIMSDTPDERSRRMLNDLVQEMQ